MKPISRAVHGFMDYMMGILLIAGPYLFELHRKNADSYIFFALGGATLLYSALTSYELGLVKLIPMRIHLVLDMLSGMLLAASPWLFGFADRVFLPHFILGIIEIVAVMLTNSTKEDSTRLI